MTTSVGLCDRLRVRHGVDLRDVEGTPVLLSVETGRYFGLEGVALDIWRLLEQGVSLREVADRLAQIYDVPLALGQKDVVEFAQRLLNAALVEIVENEN